MALRSSIFKASVSLSNLNTQYYDDLSFTIALHPSEMEERMMYRLLAFLYCAHERLEFTEGLNNPDLPDIWQKDLTGQIEHWIDLGLPEEKRIRKASGQSAKVSIFTYNEFKSKVWLEKNKSVLMTNKKINVYSFKEEEEGSLLSLVKKSMILNCMIEDEQIFLSDNDLRVQVNVSKV